MLNSGKFRFVDMDGVESVREQLNFQNNDELVNQSTAIQFGKWSERNTCYMEIYLASLKMRGVIDVYYKMTMRLMDLKTGLIEWADETEIRKQESKSFLGL